MTHLDAPASRTSPGPISALLDSDPIPVTWASLLLAIAPEPLAAAAAFAPAPVNRLAVTAGALVLAAGIAAQVTHTGVFSVPALIVLAVAAVRLWAERPGAAARH